ncbi:MAG: hypothetical protein MZV65_39345 [Chromatiales bacterium]|nr:hypothetical protein [Chromatiales bacterium]MCK7581091.1 hypothetical protein [Chromatiales bacterium]
MSVDEDELAGLSEEERAAIEGEEQEEQDEREILKSLAGDDEADDEDEDDADADDEASEPESDAAAEPEPPEVASEPEPAPEPVREPEPFTPRYQAEPVADYEARVAEIAERKKALRTQYQDGEFALDRYEEQRDALDAELLVLREANLKATLAAEQAQQASAQRWQWEQERFFSAESNAIYRQDPILASALDTAVKALAQDPANEHKPMRWFLDEADRITRERIAKLVGAPAASPSPEIKVKPKAPKPTLPPNLGDLPSAELPETGQDEWSHLDKLDGMALEQALAKLSAADQERYLRG